MELLHKEITDKILRAFYDVYNDLGFGFSEKVYENSMVVELLEKGLSVKSQEPISVFYKGIRVGEYFADLLIEDKVIIELKAGPTILAEHEAQIINYMKATGVQVGLLLNFGQNPAFKRKMFSGDKIEGGRGWLLRNIDEKDDMFQS